MILIKYFCLYKDFEIQKKYFIQTISHDLRVSTIAQIRGIELLQKIYQNELLTSINNNSKLLEKEIFEKELKMVSTIDKNTCIKVDIKDFSKVIFIITSIAIYYSFCNSTIAIKDKIKNNMLELSISYTGKALSEEECRWMFYKNLRFSTVGYGIRMHLCKK